MDEEFQALRAILSPEEILSPSTAEFKNATKCWNANEDRNPRIALRPQSLEHLQATVKFLYSSILDFAVRSTGTGSSSASDVVLDTSAFDLFDFNPIEETVVIGAGQKWGNVYRKMEEQAPGFAVVGARQAYVGVAGTILAGGLSWLSGEFGLISDPGNFLDAQIVLGDGQCVWAGEKDSELLWALRGGGGNFGVVVAVKLKAYRYAKSFCAGITMYPDSSLAEASNAFAHFVHENQNPKVISHAFLLRPKALFFNAPYKGIGFFNFDSSGSDHARSEAGLGWAYRIPETTNMMTELTFSQLSGFSDQDEKKVKGNSRGVVLAAIMPDIDTGMLQRASKWLDKVIETNPAFEAGSFAIIEALKPKTFSSTKTAAETAWPHSRPGHVLQLGVGTLLEDDFAEATAWGLIRYGRDCIAPQRSQSEFMPTFADPKTGPELVYKDNYEKLTKIKGRYDAWERFNKGVTIKSNESSKREAPSSPAL